MEEKNNSNTKRHLSKGYNETKAFSFLAKVSNEKKVQKKEVEKLGELE